MTARNEATRCYDTAIFWDVENLLKGYGMSNKIVKGLSIKAIIAEILKVAGVGSVAINRAYANWLNPKLHFLHEDLLNFDVMPVPVIGNLSGAIKNVSDIQLVIDVMEVLSSSPSISTYVIVSGDGGYAALARKLHERGKTVVGCAYKRSTNHLFEKSCDYFISIADPDEPAELEEPATICMPREEVIQSATSQQHSPERTNLIWSSIYEALSLFSSAKENRVAIEMGVNPSKIKEFLLEKIPHFDHTAVGFDKFVDFLVYALDETELAVFFKPPSHLIISLRSSRKEGFSKMSKPSTKKFSEQVEQYITDLDVSRLVRAIDRITTTESPLTITNKIREVVSWIEEDGAFRRRLKGDGLNPGTLEVALKSVITGYTYSKLGFNTRLDHYLWLTTNSQLCVMQHASDPAQLRIGLSSHPLPGYTHIWAPLEAIAPSDGVSNNSADLAACVYADTEKGSSLGAQILRMLKGK